MTDEQRALMLQGIVHDADRMDTILRQLVDAARAAAGSLELFPEQADLADLVLGIAETQRRDPDHPSIEWDGDAGPFFVDPTRLKTTILAFAEALVWWCDTGPIMVLAERRDTTLRVSVSRSGTELSAEDAEALFTPRRPGAGAGSKIGLYVARAVAEAQGGRAWTEVRDGDLTFVVELPLPA